MKVFEILRNPFVKIIGVTLIIYFALFHDRYDPEALGNRLAPQRIKNELHDAQEKVGFIISNVHLAQQIAEDNVRKKATEQSINKEVSLRDIEVGNGEDKTACGDVAEVSYTIYNNEGTQLIFKEKEKVIIGSGDREFLEKNIVGMAQNGVREINIPNNFSTSDKELIKMLQFNRSGLHCQITILSFAHNPDSKLTCK